MKNLLLLKIVMMISGSVFGQCQVDEFEDTMWICPTWDPVYLLAEEPQTGWSYSWSPTTYLSSPTSPMTTANVPAATTITYTLTVTPAGCSPIVRGTVTVINPPYYVSVSPVGPISYYYQYESPQTITITASDPRVWWFKEGVEQTTARGQQTLEITIDEGSGTEYYYAATGCYQSISDPYNKSNTVAVTRIACDDLSDYPSGIYIPSGNLCASLLVTPNYVQLQGKNLGFGTSYSYWLEPGASCFSLNGSGQLTASGCSNFAQKGTYVKSSRNGEECYMFYYVGINTNCRPSAPNNNLPLSVHDIRFALLPNPTRSKVAVVSKMSINRVEFYCQLGALVKVASSNGKAQLDIDVSELPNGIYMVRIYSLDIVETKKLVVAK